MNGAREVVKGNKIMKHVIKLSVSLIILLSFAATPALAEGKVFVMVYHSFNGDGKFDTDLSCRDLAMQMDYFKDKGFRFVTFGEMIAGRIEGDKNVLVTIDDGHRSVWNAYHQVLKPRGIKPVLGIYPAVVEHKDYVMTWREIKALADDGCELAAHGYNHLYVNTKLMKNNPAAFEREVGLSKKIIEEKTGARVRTFLCPFGVHSPETAVGLREHGYIAAFILLWKPVLVPMERNANVFELPRYMYKDNWNAVSRHIMSSLNGASTRLSPAQQPCFDRAHFGRLNTSNTSSNQNIKREKVFQVKKKVRI